MSTTTVIVAPLGNALPTFEPDTPRKQVLDGHLTREQAFKALFPRLAQLGHDASCRLVPRWWLDNG